MGIPAKFHSLENELISREILEIETHINSEGDVCGITIHTKGGLPMSIRAPGNWALVFETEELNPFRHPA